MEPNNFEKKIQQKMDELKIPPSDLVWTNIEKRIGKKHKDRKVIFIIFFLILFLFTGGYWLFNSTKNNTQQQVYPLSNLLEKNKPTSPADVQANNRDSSSDYSIISSARLPETTDTFQAVTPKTKTSPTIIQDKAGKRVADKEQKDISLKMGFVSEDKTTAFFQNKELKREKNIDSEKHNKLSNENNQEGRETEIAKAKIKNISDKDIIPQNKNDADSLLKKMEGNLTAKKSSKNLQEHKWVLGVRFSGGMSFLSNELLDINNNSGDYLSIPNSPSSGIGNSGGGSSSRVPPKTKNSTAFISGIFIEKNISKKSKISFGINYKYFSTINKTGNKIDSAQTAYNSVTYSTTYTNTYRNNFNYLELPVSLKFLLIKNNSLPVYWLAGINISRLIGSDALQFKNDPGVYYNDNSLFNKTQWGFSTGFFATLFSQKKTPVNIGPYFYYNATRLANEGLYDKKHFNFIGMSAEILFNKK